MHTAVFCVGEGDWNARYEEYMFEGTGEATSGDSDMVLGYNLPIFRAHKFRRRGPFSKFYRLHYPGPRPYAHLPKG